MVHFMHMKWEKGGNLLLKFAAVRKSARVPPIKRRFLFLDPFWVLDGPRSLGHLTRATFNYLIGGRLGNNSTSASSDKRHSWSSYTYRIVHSLRGKEKGPGAPQFDRANVDQARRKTRINRSHKQ